MVRLAIVMSVFALLACGGSETSQTGDAGDAAPAAAAVEEKAPAPAPAMEEPAAVANPKAQSCFDLIGQAEFQQALPVCIAALQIDPSNQELQDAVSKARTETAKLAAAQEAAGTAAEGAAQGAAEEATSKLGEATGDMPDMGQ